MIIRISHIIFIILWSLLLNMGYQDFNNIASCESVLHPSRLSSRPLSSGATLFNTMKRTKGPLCACGCGEPVKWAYWDKKWNKYINNHKQLKGGHSHSKETKEKIKIGNLTTKNTTKGKKKIKTSWENLDRRKQTSDRMKVLWKNPTYIQKMNIRNKKMWNDPVYIEKQKQQKHSEEHKQKMRIGLKKMWTPEYKKQYGEMCTGCGNNNWKGGISSLPYPPEWNNKLKKKIKTRDNFICKNPNCETPNSTLSIHHIDYVKQNCTLNNLITLCMVCNAKANANRKFHQNFYQKIVDDTISKNI